MTNDTGLRKTIIIRNTILVGFEKVGSENFSLPTFNSDLDA